MSEELDPADRWEDIRRAARSVANSYGGKFEWEDIAQATFLDMLEHPRRYAECNGAVMFSALKKAGHRYCQVEKGRYLTYGDQCIYSSEEVKKLLHRYYAGEAFDPGTGDVFIDRLDLLTALEGLSAGQVSLLEHKYRDGAKLSRAEQNRHGKTIRMLTAKINNGGRRQGHEGPGARVAMSNVRGQAITSAAWGGEASESGAEPFNYGWGPSYPPGTFYDWDKYNQGDVHGE